MTKTAIVTGASGQDGYYLVQLLKKLGYVVHAQSRNPPNGEGQDSVHWHIGDPKDSEFLEDLIVKTQPTEIYNLAAISRPTLSWNLARETAELNALVPHKICDLLVKHKPDCRLFQASSSDIFGDVLSEQQDERTHCVPVTPYAVAKLYALRIVGAYRQQYGLHASCGILFNHESPRRPLSFVSQKIAYASAAASLGILNSVELDERGKPILHEGKLTLGDLGVRRDFGFAGDYAEAMHMIVQHPTADDYVIGTGQEHSIQDFCEKAFSSVGLDWTEYVRVDPKLIRKIDSRYTKANTSKLRSAFNWQPKVKFEELVCMMVQEQKRLIQSTSLK